MTRHSGGETALGVLAVGFVVGAVMLLFIGWVAYLNATRQLGASVFGVGGSGVASSGPVVSPAAVLGAFVLLVAVIVGSIALRSRLNSGGVR